MYGSDEENVNSSNDEGGKRHLYHSTVCCIELVKNIQKEQFP